MCRVQASLTKAKPKHCAISLYQTQMYLVEWRINSEVRIKVLIEPMTQERWFQMSDLILLCQRLKEVCFDEDCFKSYRARAADASKFSLAQQEHTICSQVLLLMSRMARPAVLMSQVVSLLSEL